MKLLKKVSSLFLLLSILFACTQKPARIITHSSTFYGKNSKYRHNKYSASSNRKSRYIKVKEGETLYSIARKYRVPLRDIITQNHLRPPYKLKRGTRLYIPKPYYHKVKSGETIYQIARAHSMSMSSIVALNNLKSPYNVEVGQKIKISKSRHKASSKRDKPRRNYAKHNKHKPFEKRGFVNKTLDKLNHFSWPIHGKVISKFGPKSGGLYNDGINIKARTGAPVKASESGIVAYVGNELKGYGNLIIIKHSGGWITAYAHLSKTLVKRGQKVKKLQQIAKVGSTGNVNSSQLYFGLRKGRDSVNPTNYLTK